MDFVTLNNGLKMPVLGLGLYQLKGKECERCVLEAVELGYRLFDSAQMYVNEEALGNALRQCKIPRDELFITTKIYRSNTGYNLTKKSIDESLKLLQSDYIDLLLIHEPYRESKEMYKAMEEAQHDGKVKSIGISNFSKKGYLDFLQSCEVIPAINQVEAHIFYQQGELQKTLEKYGTRMEAWSPFAAGKNNFFRNPVLKDIGEKYGKSIAQTGLRFLLQKGIIIIPKTSHKDRLKENMNIFNFNLSEDDMLQISKQDREKTLFGWYY